MKWLGIGMWTIGILLIVGLVCYKAWEIGDIVGGVLAIATILIVGGMIICAPSSK